MEHVIIGSSAAGVAAAETIRRLAPADNITMISAEAGPVYSRCLLPNLLAGSRSVDGLLFRSKDFYRKNRITPILGVRADGVDSGAKNIFLQDGRKIPYDKLLIATGASTAMPPVPGLDGPGVFGLRSLADAQGILARIPAVRRAVVVGAGLVGLETAYALYRRGLEVTVVEKMSQVLPNQFDPVAAFIILREMQAEGIRFVLGRGIKEIAGPTMWQRLFGKSGMGVVLEDGERLKAELVVVATGTRCNVDLAQGSGIQVNRGIKVNAYMATSIADIFAAGDVAETVDLVTGQEGLSPIWPNAINQGKIAGFNMAGVMRKYSPLIGQQNAVEFRALPAIAVGLTNPKGEQYEVLINHCPVRNHYKKLVLDKDKLVGMVLVGDISKAGLYAGLIKKRANVQPVKDCLLDQGFSYAHFLRHSA
ncbi:MAG: NAD(P)/FAD-dependent oxidoreductase [Syntrophomonadaceae bacterium]|jgi:NAD(P)H-nitrite reductase large subunit|nr:NAD(P)/FAD-dependent oxidoreductase [Syntrophomonadaceae bacterium]